MSNPVEKAQKLGQQLFEIQTSTISKLATMQQENLQTYFNMTREFTTRAPEARDPQSVMDMQREMAATMWSNFQQSNENTSMLVREAWEQVGDAYREAFEQEDKSQA